MSQTGLPEFCLAADPKYRLSWFHEGLLTTLESVYRRVKRGEKVRLIIQVPPRHGKTRAARELFPAWVLGQEDWPIITCSYSADLAEASGQNTRDIMQSQVYKTIFPDSGLRMDSTAKGDWKTKKGGSYFATGVGGGIIGKGFKIGIIDDPFKNREEADSAVTREKVWSWYRSTFKTRRDDASTAIIIIMQRWHMDDLVGKLLDQELEFENAGIPKDQYDQWEIVSFPAIAEHDEFDAKDQLLRKAGEGLWTERFPLAEYLATKNGSEPYEWSSLYQQNPILQENAEFKKEWFVRYKSQDLKMEGGVVDVTVDLAVSQQKRADNTVLLPKLKFPDKPDWWLLPDISGRLTPLETIDAMFYLWDRYRARFWVESVGYQAALQYFIDEEMRKRNIFFNVNEIKRPGTQSKESRIRGLIPLWKTGIIHTLDSHFELEREALQFPKGRHDDRLDALSMHLDITDPTFRKEIKKKKPTFFDRFKTFH